MYAIIETGGKQYRVTSGQTISVEKLDAEAGKEIVFDKVLAIKGDSADALFGGPYLSGARVTAEVIGDGKADKVLIFKQLARKGMRKLRGHRQPYTKVKVKEIEIGGK